MQLLSFKRIATRVVSLLLLGLISGNAACTAIDDNAIEPINLEQLTALKQSAESNPLALLLIDPRPKQDFELAHIPTARNVTLSSLDGAKGIDPRLAQFESIVIYGNDPSSMIARSVDKRLMMIGYSNVRFFPGGLTEWKAANRPTESGPGSPLPKPAASTRRGNAR